MLSVSICLENTLHHLHFLTARSRATRGIRQHFLPQPPLNLALGVVCVMRTQMECIIAAVSCTFERSPFASKVLRAEDLVLR